MCQPRQVTVRATAQLREAWRGEVARTARATGVAVGQARLVHPLGTALGAPARRMFEHGLAAAPRWQPADGGYRMTVPGGHALYLPETGELELVATMTDEVAATATLTDEVTGVLEGQFDAEATGRYYADGYGGRRRDVAEREARERAQAEADRQAAEHRDRELGRTREAAVTERATRLAAEAEEAVRRELAERTALREAELGAGARQRVEGLLADVQREINEQVAFAYREAVLAYARQRGAEGLLVDESDGMINIQFELEA
jgi:hypothetical protein